ncbi:hypothetical protein [Gloeothece verrucosa]|uniref:ParB/Sulfiredoxin domain-containing protein n=1 Tax=Gloeothece verrucosa (strain PCC 7822) TaxID=497965 RepID=E0UMQ8_GLOV7|nr:hypothetical protein [Gloeothece verrucosa]ADN18238.1 hypothetical protein Cyan7822_6455 [Gloeothece verrucosa PCC 7822]
MDEKIQFLAQTKLNQLKDQLETLEKSPIEGDSKQIKKYNQDLNYCRQKIANLESFLSFAVGQKVTKDGQIGEIGALVLSPGGMPEAWVSWTIGSAPIPEQPAKLQIVDEARELLLNSNSENDKQDLLSLPALNNGNTIPEEIPTPNVESSPEELEPKESSINEVRHDRTLVINEESEPSNNQLEPEQTSIPDEIFAIGEKSEALITERSDNPVIQDFNPSDIIIDEEFKALIPSLSLEEKEQLEANILAEGIRDPLVLWKDKNILLDGHNRSPIAQKYNLPFKTVAIELEDRDAARLWLINNQLGRRNLSPEQISYLRGQRYNLEKGQGAKLEDLKASQIDRTNRGSQNDTGSKNHSNDQNNDLEEPSGHFDHLINQEPSGHFDHLINQESSGHFDHLMTQQPSGQSDHLVKTAERLANVYNVGEKTIRRDAQFATAVDLIGEVLGQEIKQDILSRQIRLNKKAAIDLAQIASVDPQRAKEVLESWTSGQKPEIAKHLRLTPGCLVQVNSPDHRDLHERTVRVACVTAKRVQVWHRKIDTTMEMIKYNLDLDQVEFVPMSDKPHVQALNDRLEKLRQYNLDPFERDFLALFDRCVALTPAEEEYLSFVERRYLSL